MPIFHHDGLSFHYRDEGSGRPFFFQHGLGADVSQPFGLFHPPSGVRLLALDCRAHGQTVPLGDPAKINLSAFADDVIALMDHLALAQAIVGGLSMGAAVAANLALRFPQRVSGLVLSRPAWLDTARPPHLAVFARLAELIRAHGAKGAKEHFERTVEYQQIRTVSPDAAASLLRQLDDPRAEQTVVRLERIPHEAPCRDAAAWRAIGAPVLVLANRQDPIHPFDYGCALARLIPGAEFREITPKSVSRTAHAADVQRELDAFLARHGFLRSPDTARAGP
jgi:pimeloyl-ACP methyl ester carboxylesterase